MAQKRNIKLRLLLLVIILIGAGLIGLYAYALSNYSKQTFIALIATTLYMSIMAAINPKKKWAMRIHAFLSFPLTIVLFLLMLAGTSIAMGSAILFAWTTAALPIILVLWLYYNITGSEVSAPFNLFAILSFTAILLSQSIRTIKYALLKIGIYRAWRKEATKREMLDVGLYLL